MGDSDNNNKEVSKGKNISVVNKIMGSPLTLDTIQRPSLISADGKKKIYKSYSSALGNQLSIWIFGQKVTKGGDYIF